MKNRVILSAGLILSFFTQPQSLFAETKTTTVKVDMFNSDGTPHRCGFKTGGKSTVTNPGANDRHFSGSPNNKTLKMIEEAAHAECQRQQSVDQNCSPRKPIFELTDEGKYDPPNYIKECFGTADYQQTATAEVTIYCICTPKEVTEDAQKSITNPAFLESMLFGS
jgi:hypothetical protein